MLHLTNLLISTLIAHAGSLYLTTNTATLNLPQDHPAAAERNFDHIRRDLLVKLLADRRTEANAPIAPDGLLMTVTDFGGPTFPAGPGSGRYVHRQVGVWLSEQPTLNAMELEWASLSLRRRNELEIAEVVFDTSGFVRLPRQPDERTFAVSSKVAADVREFAEGFGVKLTDLEATLKFYGSRVADDQPAEETVELDSGELRRFLQPGRGQAFAEFKTACARALGSFTRRGKS